MGDLGLAILVPVLGRPHRVEPFLASVEATVPNAHVLFIGDPHDELERRAIEDYQGPVRVSDEYPGGRYAEKINYGVLQTTEPLIFAAADDLEFQPRWFEKARVYLGNGCGVVGVNDFCSERVRAGRHATHFLMTRDYAEEPTIDGGRGPLHEGYQHWWVDDEFVATARARDAIRFALDSHVIHLHPMVGKAEDDETYQKGRAHRRHDHRLYIKRKRLWMRRSA